MNKTKFIKNLSKLVTIQSESYNTRLMMRYINGIVQSIGGCAISYDKYGNMYVTKGQGPYPAMVCHTDTVHHIRKAKIECCRVGDNLIAVDTKDVEQIGTGGDDKVGIHITLELLKSRDNMKAAFFLDEEVGCVGSSQADFSFFDDCLFVLECDRRGATDFVNSISGIKLYDQNFSDAIKPILKKYGRQEVSGGLTDVLEIAYATDLPVANMSCGYYEPHTDYEYINITDVINTFELCRDIFDQVNVLHEVSGKRTSYYSMNYDYKNYYNKYNYGSSYVDEEEYAETESTVTEAVKNTCGVGCAMRNGYCQACLMSADEMYEYFYEEDYGDQTPTTSLDQIV